MQGETQENKKIIEETLFLKYQISIIILGYLPSNTMLLG